MIKETFLAEPQSHSVKGIFLDFALCLHRSLDLQTMKVHVVTLYNTDSNDASDLSCEKLIATTDEDVCNSQATQTAPCFTNDSEKTVFLMVIVNHRVCVLHFKSFKQKTAS